ncbi:unnamed protein product [Meloidogyne enterolobii]|uniref:Uncharacterized protein n=1 Tax=Meloidogyne enterolobii TaxID=390850 RepID=A0ACB0YEL0_MELEN
MEENAFWLWCGGVCWCGLLAFLLLVCGHASVCLTLCFFKKKCSQVFFISGDGSCTVAGGMLFLVMAGGFASVGGYAPLVLALYSTTFGGLAGGSDCSSWKLFCLGSMELEQLVEKQPM